MTAIILCPASARTGGPEALFQLSDAMVDSGIDARMWLASEEELAMLTSAQQQGQGFHNTAYKLDHRETTIDEYKKYKTVPFRGWPIPDGAQIVLAEVYIHLLPFFSRSNVLVWWLSVDNAFKALSNINLNQLRAPNIRHAAQSNYASNFLTGIGIRSTPLTDYTVTNDTPLQPIGERKKVVAINTSPKVITPIDRLTNEIALIDPSIEVRQVNSMSRQDVYELFGAARLFIDLGSFPGRDRMCREALALGANVLISNTGAGGVHNDFLIPDAYRASPFNIAEIAKKTVQMTQHPEPHHKSFTDARRKISSERDTFVLEVIQCFMHSGQSIESMQ